ncbi:MAG: hypothetical protein J5565_07265 [Muribaculaceae bacterium]|nr:hypothetical protein [Muribaculaceae bacterium]
MKQHYQIDLVEEYSNVNFYSIHLDNQELTELERFFEKSIDTVVSIEEALQAPVLQVYHDTAMA